MNTTATIETTVKAQVKVTLPFDLNGAIVQERGTTLILSIEAKDADRAIKAIKAFRDNLNNALAELEK